MKSRNKNRLAVTESTEISPILSGTTISRREFLAGSAALSVTILLPGGLSAAVNGKKSFTILHTNDMHSSFIGMGPAADYTPFSLNDDATRGGYARLAALIAKKKESHKSQGPVLVLDAGDYSMGTAFAAATREIGGELKLMGMMGYDATTFGNHEFDLGPDGLGRSISVAAKAGRIPAVVAANIDFTQKDTKLTDLQRLAKTGVIRPYTVIERGGIRFGIFGLLGQEAQHYTSGGAVTYTDPIETAKEMVKTLRDKEKVDLIIALSHGGMEKGKDGRFTEGEDVRLARDVPGIDVVISGHSHTFLAEATIVNDRIPVVQAGKESQCLGELTIAIDNNKLTVESYKLHPIDDSIAGDQDVAAEIDNLKKGVTAAVFASRGYSIDQPLAIAAQDLPNTYSDIAASTLLANLCTDAFRKATKADIGFTVNGTMRAGLSKGKTGVQTVYDVFAMAPLGGGIVDNTAGSALVTGYLNGLDLKNLLEYMLVDNPTHPGEFFPRASGMRFRYDMSRQQYDAVTAIELGDMDRGYKAIDISGKSEKLYSFTCPLMVGQYIVAIPKFSKGKLQIIAKNKKGQQLKSKVEALEDPRSSTPDLLSPTGTTDRESVATGGKVNASTEIKEWQAIMDYLRTLPAKQGELPVIPVDARAAEVRAIKEG